MCRAVLSLKALEGSGLGLDLHVVLLAGDVWKRDSDRAVCAVISLYSSPPCAIGYALKYFSTLFTIFTWPKLALKSLFYAAFNTCETLLVLLLLFHFLFGMKGT